MQQAHVGAREAARSGKSPDRRGETERHRDPTWLARRTSYRRPLGKHPSALADGDVLAHTRDVVVLERDGDGNPPRSDKRLEAAVDDNLLEAEEVRRTMGQ